MNSGERAGEDLCAPDVEMLGIHAVLLVVERRIAHQVVEREKRASGGRINSGAVRGAKRRCDEENNLDVSRRHLLGKAAQLGPHQFVRLA